MPPSLAISGAGAGFFGGARQGLAGLQNHFQNKSLTERRMGLLTKLEETKNEWATGRESLRFEHDKQLQDERLDWKAEHTPAKLAPQLQAELDLYDSELGLINKQLYGEFAPDPDREKVLTTKKQELMRSRANIFNPPTPNEDPSGIIDPRMAGRGAPSPTEPKEPAAPRTGAISDFISQFSASGPGAIGDQAPGVGENVNRSVEGILEFGQRMVDRIMGRDPLQAPQPPGIGMNRGLWNLREPQGIMESRAPGTPVSAAQPPPTEVLPMTTEPPRTTGRGPTPLERGTLRTAEPPPAPAAPAQRLTGRGPLPSERQAISPPSTSPETTATRPARQDLVSRLRNLMTEWGGGSPEQEPLRAPEPPGVLLETATRSRQVAPGSPRPVETALGPGPIPTEGSRADVARTRTDTAEPRGILEQEIQGSALARQVPRDTVTPEARTPGTKTQRVQQNLERTMESVGRKTFGTKDRGIMEDRESLRTPERAATGQTQTLASVMEHESLRLEPYQDRGGQAIGYGHNLNTNGRTFADGTPIPSKLTREQAERLLREDLAQAERDIQDLVGQDAWTSMSEVRKGALIELSYQHGRANTAQFTQMLGAVERGDWQRVAGEILDSETFRDIAPARLAKLSTRIANDSWTQGLSNGG